MDKRIIIPDFWVSPMPKQPCPDFILRYGLWIFAWHQDYMGADMPPAVRRRFEFYSLSHMHGGHGFFIRDGQPMREMEPGDAVLMGPGIRHGYGGLGDSYIEDSVAFCGPVADHLAQAGMIPNDVVRIGRARRLLPIIELAKVPSLDSQYRANMQLQQLLLELFLNGRKSVLSPHRNKIAALLELLRQNPARNWTVEEMAEYCDLSPVQFRRMFLRHAGILPKAYLMHLRMKAAAGMLLSGDVRIQDVAQACGFDDPFHFSRVFRQHFRQSPRVWREQRQSGAEF